MKRCILEGPALPDAAAVYQKLAEDLDFPAYFGHNPEALWDAGGEPVEIVWRQSARAAARLGPDFERIIAVLRRAAADGWINFQLFETTTPCPLSSRTL
jgi:RNAse (barnase) inhibitor barstar